MEKVMEGRRRRRRTSGLICGGLVVVACGALFQSFSHPSIHPHTHTHCVPLGRTFARTPFKKKQKKHQFCLCRAKAFCGFFNIKGRKKKREEGEPSVELELPEQIRELK